MLLAGRALRPVHALTQTAAGIARSQDFGKRVPVDGRRDELGRLAETFNDMLANLEHAYRAQKRFVADASHELRAPLTAIQGNLELLRRHPDASRAQKEEALQEADREAHRLSQLVADLLALARADAGVPIRRQKVELDRVVLEALATAQHLAHGRSIELATLEPALIEGNPDRLKELFLILLDNAVKYTLPGEQVALTLCRQAGSAEVIVHDDGAGIAPEDLSHVFERFYRADPARTRDPGGTGLGLPIARWIAEAHGGHMELESKPATGTTVSMRLPLIGP
ncbi:MAG TPA: HAMP domain-containing sensor histidine kinase [Rubrobacter sp.]|nr:HAMP domain-containing sensor histidine kinase [Rubrobacter sp.]